MLKIIDRNLEILFIIAVSILSLWGLWVLSDAYCLFSRGYVQYNFSRQLAGLFIALCVFVLIQKYEFKKIHTYPGIWFAFAIILTVLPLFLPWFDGLRNRDLRNMFLLSIIAFAMFRVGAINNRILYSKKIKYAVILYAVSGFWITTYIYGPLASLLFFLSLLLCLVLSDEKKTALYIFVINLLVFFSMAAIRFEHIFNRVIYFLRHNETPIQVQLSLECFHKGGFWGIGPAGAFASSDIPFAKLLAYRAIPSHMPDFQAGFIFSVFGLEYGIVGILLLSALFLIIFYSGYQAAIRTKQKGERVLLVVMVSILAVLVIIGMTTPLNLFLPNGSGLPFFSIEIGKQVFTFFVVGIIYKNLIARENSNENEVYLLQKESENKE